MPDLPYELSPRVRAWLEKLLAAEDLTNWAYNLLIDLNERRLPEVFLEQLDLRLDGAGLKRWEQAEIKRVFEDVQKALEDQVFCGGGPCQEEIEQQRSRVMSLRDMQFLNIGFFRAEGFDQDSYRQALDELRKTPETFRAKLSGRLRGRSPHFFWVTFEDDVQRIEATPKSRLGELIRDTLGFITTGPVDWVVLSFPRREMPAADLHRPTLLEGGSNPIYCSWPGSESGPGFTWSLADNGRGVREYVTRARDLRQESVEVRFLATLESTRLPLPDWRQLCDRLEPTEIESLRSLLEM